MERSIHLWFCVGLSICILGCVSPESGRAHSVESTGFAANRVSTISKGNGECEITNDVQILSGANRVKVTEATERLITMANASQNCRQQIISALVKGMDKPNLDFKTDYDAFLFWRNGGDVLGQLKAVEALDLLISHIGLSTWFWSSSMANQPALAILIQMGPVAVPKLSKALRENSDRDTRRFTIFCLTYIGGPAAFEALKGVVESERDPLIRQFIRVSIKNLDNPEHKMKNNVRWYGFFLKSGGSARHTAK